MGSKLEPGKYDCYAHALPDEQMFVLLARDPCAPKLIELWADMRDRAVREGWLSPSEMTKTDEARRCAIEMRRWRRNNYGEWRK